MKFGALVALVLAPGLYAQSASFQYFYDDAHELFRVIDSTGTLIEYIYDPAGNITQINRSTIASGSLAILNVKPLTGGVGSTITIFGQNFSTVAANNSVQINGVNVAVLSATTTQLTIQLPAGITAGQVTVTVNGVTATSGPSLVFQPLPPPVITSLTPDGALAGTVIPYVQVTGIDMTGAIFSFPAGATAGTLNVTPTAATLQVTTMAGIRGAFPLIATTTAGSSTSTVTPGNHFIVLLSPDEADTPVFSVLNTADPTAQSSDSTNISNSADSQVASVLNQSLPSGGASDPTNISNQADSQVVSLLNESLPASGATDPTNVTDEADSALASLLNGSNGPVSATPAIAARRNVREFAAGLADPGSVQVAQSGSQAGLVAGQTLAIGIRAQQETREVELIVNGASLAKSRLRPWVFTFNVPAGVPTLTLLAVVRDENGAQLASYGWQQRVVPDAGATLTGRVVDAEGHPISGARVTVEAAGLYGEFFESRAPLTQMPDLRQTIRTRAGLISGLDWLNPQGAFGDNPMGMATATSWAARFSGQFLAPEAGTYTFPMSAQAAAALRIDGNAVAGNVDLAAGIHTIEVSYYKAQDPAALQILWVEPTGAVTPVPLEGVSASDPALEMTTGPDGSFSIVGAPAKVDGLRVVVSLPDGRSAASSWRATANGSVAGLGDIVVAPLQH